MQRNENFLAYLALAAVCFFWGTTYLALRIGVESVPPFLFTAIRQSIAGLILMSLFLFWRTKMPSRGEFWVHIISGFLMITLGNGLVAWAEMYVTSGVAALICALLPFWVIMIGLLVGSSDKLNLQVWAGMLLGWVGLALIFGDSLADFANPNYTIGILMIFVANIAWASGTIITKNVKRVANPLFGAGIQLFSGGVFAFMVSLLTENISKPNFTFSSFWALVYLIVFGSVVAFGCFLYVLSKLPATLTSMYAYINPIVAMLLGWLILNEKLNGVTIIAFAVTVLGVYLVNQGFRPKKVSKKKHLQVAE